MLMTCLMLTYFVSMALLRPFRVSLFNFILAVNMLFLALNLLTGALRTSFDVYRYVVVYCEFCVSELV